SSSGAAAGAAIGYNIITNTIRAYIEGSTVTATLGNVNVAATSNPTLVSITVGGAGGENFTFGGSLSINSIANDVDAHIDDSTVTADDNLNVSAYEEPIMVVLAGGIAISGSGAAVGAAIAYNYIGGSFSEDDPDAYYKKSSGYNTGPSDQTVAYILNS